MEGEGGEGRRGGREGEGRMEERREGRGGGRGGEERREGRGGEKGGKGRRGGRKWGDEGEREVSCHISTLTISLTLSLLASNWLFL